MKIISNLCMCVYSFRAQAGELWVKNEKVMCGYISEDTRVRFIILCLFDLPNLEIEAEQNNEKILFVSLSFELH